MFGLVIFIASFVNLVQLLFILVSVRT